MPAREKQIKLVLSDIDGTLVNSEKQLTRRTLEAAERLRKGGIKLAITSGRPPLGLKMLVPLLRLECPIAAYNGGAFVTPDMIPIEERPLDREVALEIATHLERSGIDAWIYGTADWWLRDLERPHVAHEIETVKFQPLIMKEFKEVESPLLKVVGVSDDAVKLLEAEEEIVRQYPRRVSASRSQPYYLDITNPLANKGEAVDFLSSYLHIPLAEILTIGDGNNDCLMFKKSGFSVAMDNANDYVKSHAGAVVASNDRDGFAEAVERYVLGG